MLFAADGEPLAALGATALEHQSTVFCAHPHEKAVSPRATAGVRLESTYALGHIYSDSTRNEPLMLAKSRRTCQRAEVCVTVLVPAFRRFSSTNHPAKPMRL